MLNRLQITNLAIIENIDVSFKEGFTVLTGETGAGKSLVIDSLSLLLGSRATSELIRQGEEKAIIKGYFQFQSPQFNAVLAKLNIPQNDGEIIIERTISKTKNIIKVNDVSLSLNELNRIVKHLADIHTQFDFEKILNPLNYLEIIDGLSFEQASSYRREYISSFEEYKKNKDEYHSLLERQKKIEEGRDFFEYQLKELNVADLKENEEEAINEELSLLRNYNNIYSLTEEANALIHTDFLDSLYELNQVLAKLSNYQNEYKETYELLDERYYEIDDRLNTLKKKFQNLDYDPNRLNELEQREYDLSALKRKYKKNLNELIAYRDELRLSVGQDSSLEENLSAAKKAMEEKFEEAYRKGQELSLVRRRIAKSIEKEIEHNLKDLLLQSRFQVVFKDIKKEDGDAILKENGLDEVDFLIETNIGEGLKPLAKVVSGGEASRIMLAFKAIFIKANKIDTVVFDEIDTGISGETARAVAKKIREISLSTQVIAITHMPQVASLSDHHILISKEVKGQRTYAHTKELSLEEKIKMVAYLISSGKITEKQLEYAEEMMLADK